MLKAVFVLKMFKFLPELFGQVGKRLGKSAKVNFKIYDVTTWQKNNYNTHTAQYSRSKGKQAMKFGQLTEYNIKNICLEKSNTKCGGEASPRPVHKNQN